MFRRFGFDSCHNSGQNRCGHMIPWGIDWGPVGSILLYQWVYDLIVPLNFLEASCRHFRADRSIVCCSIATCKVMGRDGVVGIATRYGLDGPGIESRWGRVFSAPVQTGPGAYPASYTMGTVSLSRG
jgi:hypothetical protein